MEDIDTYISREEFVTWVGYIYFNKSRLKDYLAKLRAAEPSTPAISSKGYKHAILQRILDSEYGLEAMLAAADVETSKEALTELRQKLVQMQGFRQLIFDAADPS